jgi:polar amino acid transport system substrate-binding protein
MKAIFFSILTIFLTIYTTMTNAANIEIIKAELAPQGKIRASINVGNPILAKRDSENSEPYGVSIDLAKNLAKELNVQIELVVFDSAGKSVDAVANKKADFGFFAIDPVRGQEISFTNAYVVIEGAYVVPNNSPIKSNDEVDQAHNRIVVGKGSAYDLYLTREIKHAKIVHAPTSPKVVEFFVEGNYEVGAGVKQQLEMDLEKYPNIRLLPGRFMQINQSMGVNKDVSNVTKAYFKNYVERMKASGFVADALKRHQIQGAAVAPLQAE